MNSQRRYATRRQYRDMFYDPDHPRENPESELWVYECNYHPELQDADAESECDECGEKMVVK